MRRFVEGVDRGQSTLFPECLEDWIAAVPTNYPEKHRSLPSGHYSLLRPKPPSRSLSPCHFRQCRMPHLSQRIRCIQILTSFLHQMLSFEILHERIQGLEWDLE